MSTIQIGSETRDLSDFDESWAAQQINKRRQDGLDVCVRISITTSGVNVTLATPACGGGGGGGGRPPNSNEQEIFDLWNGSKLNSNDFAVGNLIAFVKRIRKALS